MTWWQRLLLYRNRKKRLEVDVFRIVAAWTGLERCGTLYQYTLDIGNNSGFLHGYRSNLDPVSGFGDTSHVKPDVDPVTGLYQFTVNTSQNRVVMRFGADGNQYLGVDLVQATVQGYGLVYLFWDAATSRYDATSQSLTDFFVGIDGQRTSFVTSV